MYPQDNPQQKHLLQVPPATSGLSMSWYDSSLYPINIGPWKSIYTLLLKLQLSVCSKRTWPTTNKCLLNEWMIKKKKESINRLGLPWWLSSKEYACSAGEMCRRCGFNSWVVKIPWRRKWQPTPVFLPGKSHGQRSLVGYSPWDCKRVGYSLVTKTQHKQMYKQRNKRCN